MSNELKQGLSYIAYFPNSVLTTVYKLLEIHCARERHETLYTFLDDNHNKIKITRGATKTMRFIEMGAVKPRDYNSAQFDNDKYANSKEWTSDDEFYG
jgi:hypothetical protein